MTNDSLNSSLNTRHSTTLLLKNGTCILPGKTAQADILIKNGQIIEIGSIPETKSDEVIDCKGLHVLPGIIDTQVHFREPGATHKETLETGMMAAAAGGVTGIFEMPNTSPLTTTPEELKNKLDIAVKAPWTNYAFYFGATAENAHNLPEWENLPGVCGVKIFMGSSTGDLLVADDKHIENILRNGKRIVAVHAEDEQMMEENKKTILKDSHDPAMHPVWRSVESSVSATTRLLNLARKTGRHVHVLHISTAEEMDILLKNKDIATVEILPNHLTMYAPDCYNQLGTYAQQNPPIREKRHQDALWKAIEDGTVDMIGSDHAPHTREEKDREYPKSPSGTPGVQTLVPIMLDHINNGRLTLEKFVDLTAHNPARIHKIKNKGRIEKGYDADFTIVDLKKTVEITNEQQKSKSGWTPYNGRKVTGWPVMTIINGQIAMREDALFSPAGKQIEFHI